MCLTPYLTVYALVYLTSFSQFFDQAVFLFIAGIGFFQTYVTAYLNIASTANIAFPTFYIEPYLYVSIIAMDAFRLLESQHLIVLYCILAATVLIKYLLVMASLVSQLTKFLNINFLTVKQKSKKQ